MTNILSDKKLSAEMRQILDKNPPPLLLALDPIKAFMVLSHLMVALRHPLNGGPSIGATVGTAVAIQTYLTNLSPALGRHIDDLWSPLDHLIKVQDE